MTGEILKRFGWEKDFLQNKKLTYFLQENNCEVANLIIENNATNIEINFKSKNKALSSYLIIFNKEKQQFDLERSSFKFSTNEEYLSFFDILQKQIINQEKQYSEN